MAFGEEGEEVWPGCGEAGTLCTMAENSTRAAATENRHFLRPTNDLALPLLSLYLKKLKTDS